MTGNRDSWKKIITYLVVVVALVHLLIVDIRVVSTIRQKNVEEYTAVDAGAFTKKLKRGTVDTRFVPVSSQIHAIALKGNFPGKEKDTIGYRIVDPQGEEVYHQEGVLVSKIYDAQNRRLPLDVSGVNFQTGETYQLQVSFDLKGKAKLAMDKNGLVLVQAYPVTYQGWLYGIIVAVHLCVAFFMFAIYKWGFHHRVFLGLLLSVGILAVILSTPFSRDDEFRHFVRVYDLATGQKYHHYGDMPEKVYGVVTQDEQGAAAYVEIPAEVDAMRQLDYDNQYGYGGYLSERNGKLCFPKLWGMLQQAPQEGRAWVSAAGTYGRPLCAYWPQVVMVWLGNLLGVRGIFLYHMAKTGQMLVAALAYWLSWRLAPNYKYIISVIALMPVSVCLAASCSCDGLMIAEVVLGIAMILHAGDKKVSLRKPGGILYWIFFGVLVYWIFRIKIPYAIICLGFLPMLIEKKPSKKVMGLIAVLAVALVGVMVVKREAILYQGIGIVMPIEHWNYWMENFRWVTYMILRKGKNLMRETMDALRGNGLIPYSGLMLLAAVLTKKTYGIIKKLYSLFLFFLMLLVVVLFGYSLTPPDYGDIVGVTYRYVLPFVPLFLLALPAGNETTEKVLDTCYPILMISVVFASVFTFGMF